LERTPELRARLLAALPHITAVVFLMRAPNDDSINLGEALHEQFGQLASPQDLSTYRDHAR
jgi:hypothetical protein